MIISLTGFMGSGKSSVGRELPTLLSLPGGPFDFIDLDESIVESEGMSVNEIFEKKGESGFRSIETRCLEMLLEQYEDRNLILALGGGTVLLNSAVIREKTLCIYLCASVDTLVSRLVSDTSRPLLAEHSAGTDNSSCLENADIPAGALRNDETENREKELRNRIERLYASRESTYQSIAHHIVTTDGLCPVAVASRIAGML